MVRVRCWPTHLPAPCCRCADKHGATGAHPWLPCGDPWRHRPASFFLQLEEGCCGLCGGLRAGGSLPRHLPGQGAQRVPKLSQAGWGAACCDHGSVGSGGRSQAVRPGGTALRDRAGDQGECRVVGASHARCAKTQPREDRAPHPHTPRPTRNCLYSAPIFPELPYARTKK